MQRIHFTQSLETLDIDLATFFLRFYPIEHTLLLGFVEGIKNVFADIDAIQRRHGDKNVTGGDQRPKMAHKQCTYQRGNVQSVRICVGQDADLVIAQAGQVVGGRVYPQCYRDIVNLLRRQDFLGINFPGIQDFAAQRQDRLKLAVPGLLGRAAGRITFHKKQFTARWILAGAVSQLARESRTGGHFFAGHFFRGTQPALGIVDAHFCQLFRFLSMLVEP